MKIRKLLQIMNKVYFIFLLVGARGTLCMLEAEFINQREFPSSRKGREIHFLSSYNKNCFLTKY